MRISAFLCLLLTLVMGSAGCFGKAKRSQQGPAPTPGKPVLVPSHALVGKIVRVMPAGRFVVITFPVGHLPILEQRLNVFRNGLKVGELKVTGPQLDDNIVADLVAGDAQPGDEVKP